MKSSGLTSAAAGRFATPAAGRCCCAGGNWRLSAWAARKEFDKKILTIFYYEIKK
jgi:hypothetical protein